MNKGAAALIRNGKIIITYSASATDANYCMGLLHCDENSDFLDPHSWYKSEFPVLKTNEAAQIFGPSEFIIVTFPK